MKEKVRYGKTPNGGDYSKIVYMNDDDEVVDESVATQCRILEYKKNGKLVQETFAFLSRKK